MAKNADLEAGLDIGDYLLRSGDGITSTETPDMSAPVHIPAVILSRGQRLMQRLADRNPAINSFVDMLGLGREDRLDDPVEPSK